MEMNDFKPPRIQVGALVKLSDGRWARYQRVATLEAHESSILVAVELEASQQQLLNEANAALVSYEARGIPVHLRLDEATPEGAATYHFAAA